MGRVRQLVILFLLTALGLFVAIGSSILILPDELIVVSSLIKQMWKAVLRSPKVFMTFILWQLVILYTIPVSFWDYEVFHFIWSHYHSSKPSTPDVQINWAPDAIQIRILTIDNESVVQETVDSIPLEFNDVLVVAEKQIDIEGAEVLVVPDEFTCEATDKGRALEWARIHHPTDKEYVLYLDEDTKIPTLDGIPSNADIVQFRERPVRTGGLLPYLAEIHRIGFNIEQLAFQYQRIPFYSWGGGIAIRRSLEDKITWNVDTVVEDSVFTWRAVIEEDATYEVMDTFFENQAPPSVRAMISQRRRWITGARAKSDLLPTDYQFLYHTRDIGWAISVFGPMFWLIAGLTYLGIQTVPLTVVFLPNVYTGLSLTLLAHVYVWSILGLWNYRESLPVWVLLLLITPFVVTIHSVGALYGLVMPATGFEVTEKVTGPSDQTERTDFIWVGESDEYRTDFIWVGDSDKYRTEPISIEASDDQN